MKRTRLSPMSAKRRKRDASYPAARDEVYVRADGYCEATCAPDCTGRLEQVHHIAGRGGPAPHDLENLLGVCLPCHEYIERNRAWAYEAGLLRSRLGGAA